MTQKEIKQKQKRISKIWDELEPFVAGTGAVSLIDELVDIEIQLEQECNQ
jgi:hypothetical protein